MGTVLHWSKTVYTCDTESPATTLKAWIWFHTNLKLLRISGWMCHLHNARVNTRGRKNVPSWFFVTSAWPDLEMWPISHVSDEFSPLTEQHAVQELTKASMSGIAIDGEVLSYLELAQVSVHCFLKIFWPTAELVLTPYWFWALLLSGLKSQFWERLTIKLSFIFYFKEGFSISSQMKHLFK